MAAGFSSPGVTVQELASAPIAPGGGNPTAIALVGTGQGYIPFTERVVLTGVATVLLTQTGIVTGSVTVSTNSTAQVVGTGSYAVAQAADPDGVALSGDETFTIRRVAAPASAPTTAIGSATGITASVGVYYAVSYSNGTGETGIGPASTVLTPSNQKINLSAIPISADSTVTSRLIYRKIVAPDGDGLFHVVATINDNTTTVLASEAMAEITAEAAAQPKPTVNSGDTVVVSYNYTNTSYYKPALYQDYRSVQSAYGSPFNLTSGAVTSDITFAALLAFGNGAPEVIIQPSLTSGITDFTNAFAALQDIDNIAYIVPISGNSSIHAAAEAHCTSMNTQGFYRSCIVGKDGSATTVLPATLRAAAQAFNDENVTLISPAAFEIINPVTGSVTVIGSHYVGAVVAGALAARDPQIPLTRKPFALLSDVHDFRSRSDKSLDDAAGLFVIENMGGVIRCYHSLTTAAGNVNTREQSVVRVKHEIARTLGFRINQAIIGQVMPSSAVSRFLNGYVSGILDSFVQTQMIDSYANVASRPTADPTIVEVTFQFTPIYPINQVNVGFTINTTTGQVGVPQAA